MDQQTDFSLGSWYKTLEDCDDRSHNLLGSSDSGLMFNDFLRIGNCNIKLCGIRAVWTESRFHFFVAIPLTFMHFFYSLKSS